MRIEAATLSALVLAALLTTAACGGETAGGKTAGANAWVGHTYLLEIPHSQWRSQWDQGVGELLDQHFVSQFVIQVDAEADGNLQMLVGTANAGVQEPCNPTTAVTAPATYPEIQIGPFDFPIYIRHEHEPIAVYAKVYGLTLTNVLPNGETIAEEGELLATFDMRELSPLALVFSSNPTADAVCLALIDFYDACEACPSDGQQYCTTFRALGLGATEGDPIEPIRATDVPASCTE